MLNIIRELEEINAKNLENQIRLKHGILDLMCFELPDYKNLIVKINNEKNSYASTRDRAKYISLYKQVYLAYSKKLRNMLKQIKIRNFVFYPPLDEKIFGLDILVESGVFDDSNVTQERLYVYAENCFKKAINKINEELYIINHYPFVYYNHKNSYIGGQFNYKYKNEILIYNKVAIMQDNSHHYALHINQDTTLKDSRAILNIFAFLNGTPNFEFMNNTSINQRLNTLYSNFDMLDCIRFRNPNYLKSDTDKPIYLQKPILKNTSKYAIVAFEKLPHEGIMDLYHASLKQFEPLPRCIFLYRVFEYAATENYKKVFGSEEYKPEDALNYYLELALSYNPNPLFYIDYGRKNHKPKLFNFFTVLKTEAKHIKQEWSIAPFLSAKSLGEIIYVTGRNFTAHGASGNKGERNMQYDYDKNYLHINNVNILLELIARYVIELLNPQLKNIVDRKHINYLDYESK